MRRDAEGSRRLRPRIVATVVVLLGSLAAGRVWSVYRSSPGRPRVEAAVEDPRRSQERARYFDEHIRRAGIPLHPAEYWRSAPPPGEEAAP